MIDVTVRLNDCDKQRLHTFFAGPDDQFSFADLDLQPINDRWGSDNVTLRFDSLEQIDRLIAALQRLRRAVANSEQLESHLDLEDDLDDWERI